MNREEFGQLVKALRNEVIMFPEAKAMTQDQLADKINEPARAIGQIEQGNRANLEPLLLAKMADAFDLTSMERAAFHNAAASVDVETKTSNTEEPEKILDLLLNEARTIQVPAIIYDPLYTAVAANTLILKLGIVPDDLLDSGGDLVSGFNTLRYFFSDQSPYPDLAGPSWEQFAIRNIQHFRASSLPYRHTKRFEHIFKELCEHARFRDCWARTKFTGKDIFYGWEGMSYHHPSFGPLNYIISSVPTLTNAGELWLVTYVPRDKQTVTVFQKMVSQFGANMHRFAQWPYKAE